MGNSINDLRRMKRQMELYKGSWRFKNIVVEGGCSATRRTSREAYDHYESQYPYVVEPRLVAEFKSRMGRVRYSLIVRPSSHPQKRYKAYINQGVQGSYSFYLYRAELKELISELSSVTNRSRV